jgi:hypothetical protein
MKTYKLTSKSGTIYSASTEKDGRSLDFNSLGITVEGSAFRKANRSEVEAIFSMLAMSALGLVPNDWKFEVIDNEKEAKAAEAKKKKEEANKHLRRYTALCEVARIANDACKNAKLTEKEVLSDVLAELWNALTNFEATL